MCALRSSDRKELRCPPILSEAGLRPTFAESFHWLENRSKELGFHLYLLPKMRAAEVRVRLRLDLWIKSQFYHAIPRQPSGEDFRAVFNVPCGIILACLRRRCLGVAE